MDTRLTGLRQGGPSASCGRVLRWSMGERGGQWLTMKVLITTVRELLAAFNRAGPVRPVEAREVGRRPGDAADAPSRIGRAERLLCWRPQYDLAEAISHSLQWAALRDETPPRLGRSSRAALIWAFPSACNYNAVILWVTSLRLPPVVRTSSAPGGCPMPRALAETRREFSQDYKEGAAVWVLVCRRSRN